ncbi:MAG: 4-hydroxy-tetrahydrodipicolinate reductase [Candidatus Krumholzibacteriales bacterium]
MNKVILVGALGSMGRILAEEISGDAQLSLAGAVEAQGHQGIGSEIQGVKVTDSLDELLDRADVAVDFSAPENSVRTVEACADNGVAAVVGTTGISGRQLSEMKKRSVEIPLLISPNMSMGVNLLFDLVGEVASVLPDFDIEITEIHHNRKKDSPSGTAARIGEIVSSSREGGRIVHGREGEAGPRSRREIGMHSLRGGDVTGEHTVIFAGEGERLELVHRAHSRRTFARGTVRAIHFMLKAGPGLYTMHDILGL